MEKYIVGISRTLGIVTRSLIMWSMSLPTVMSHLLFQPFILLIQTAHFGMVVDMFVLVFWMLMIERKLQESITVAIRAQDNALFSGLWNHHLPFVRALGVGHLSMVAKIIRVPFAKEMKIVEIIKVGMNPVPVDKVMLNKPIRKSFPIYQDAITPDLQFLQPRLSLLQLRLWPPLRRLRLPLQRLRRQQQVLRLRR